MGQNFSEGKKSTHYPLIRMRCCLIKNLARKTQWDKTIAKGKRVQRALTPSQNNIFEQLLEMNKSHLQ